jgi:hypothetical protein
MLSARILLLQLEYTCPMLFEFREYTCLPGKRDEWVKLMEEKIVPFQISKGVVVIGMFISETDPDLYYWVRRFDSEEARMQIYKDVYENDFWKNEMTPKVIECLDRSKTKNVRLLPTAKSVIQ